MSENLHCKMFAYSYAIMTYFGRLLIILRGFRLCFDNLIGYK